MENNKSVYKNIVVYFLLLLLIFSCGIIEEDEYHNIPEDEKFKFEEGSILSYTNNDNDTIIFLISHKINYTHRESSGGTDAGGPFIDYEVEEVYLCPIGIDTCDVYYTDVTFHSSIPSGCDLCFIISHGKIYWKDQWFTMYDDSVQHMNNMLIKGKNYSDVYKLVLKTVLQDTLIKDIYYNYNYGILKYVTENGKLFELLPHEE